MKHLFLLIVNNSGSSALMQVLGRCRHAVCFPKLLELFPNAKGDTRDMITEGQVFFGVGPHALGPQPGPLRVPRIWTEKAAVFADPAQYRWPRIKEVWSGMWGRDERASLPDAVALEKSPTNILRADMLAREFPGARFIVMTRDPYAVVEGIARRHRFSIERCARHWQRATAAQVDALDRLPGAIAITYEALCAQDPSVREAIVALVPEFDDLSLDVSVTAHSLDGATDRGLVNLNERQIANLSKAQVATITEILGAQPALLERFGYRLRKE